MRSQFTRKKTLKDQFRFHKLKNKQQNSKTLKNVSNPGLMKSRRCVRFLPLEEKIKTLKQTKRTLTIVQDMTTKEKKEFLARHGLLKRKSKAPINVINTIVTSITTSTTPISKLSKHSLKSKKKNNKTL